jgi:hypothetical protein
MFYKEKSLLLPVLFLELVLSSVRIFFINPVFLQSLVIAATFALM